MNRQNLLLLIDKLENFAWTMQRYAYRFSHRDYKEAMIRNREYSGIHRNKRCFILGNGPSLKQENGIDLLRDEFVFTVNQMFRSELFDIVNPNFHVIQDPLFFSLREEVDYENDTLQYMQNLNKRSDLICVLPYSAKKYAEINGIGGENNIYLDCRLRFHEQYANEIVLHNCLPISQNVIHMALYSAIGMGFSEIYLLGCDMTGMLLNFVRNDIEQSDREFGHSYPINDFERKRMKQVYANNTNEFMLSAYGATFRIFRLIDDYCSDHGITLFNTSAKTALDNIKRKPLDEVIFTK